tara:strand:+ start:303627 stop:305804 length:2178 start_codon:yes stop_codon:yes gene_type:complete
MSHEPGLDPAQTILVVDDDPTMRLAVSKALTTSGFTVRLAENGSAGLAAFHDQTPDMIISDLNMPVMNGYEFCRAVRRSRLGLYIPFLVMTGSEGFGSVEAAYEAGATDFISKPLNFALLNHRVRYILRSRDTFIAWRETQEQTAKLGWVLNSSSNEVVFTDNDGVITNLNNSVLRNLGLERSAVVGKPIDTLIHSPRDDEAFRQILAQLGTGSSKEAQFEGRIQRGAEGAFYPVEGHAYALSSDLTGEREMIFVFEDVSQRKSAERRMHKLAYYDTLTHLPNRTLFVQNFKRFLELARRQDHKMALLFVDLDNFKDVNDTLGHNAGDELLRKISQVILGSIRSSDLMGLLGDESVSRFGGDEFAVLLSHIGSEDDAVEVAQRIIDATKTPVLIRGRELVVTPSIGIVLFPEHGRDVDTLLRKADIAMYEAKKRGRNSFQIYSNAFFSHGLEKLDMLRDLELAIDKKEMVLHYQPKFDIESGQITGFEALLRWNRAKAGLVAPDQFIPLAEDSSLIRPIGAWVIWETCRQISRWQFERAGFPLSVAVNLSARQLQDDEIVSTIANALKRFDLAPECLDLEITETVIMGNMSSCLDVLNELKSMGCRLSLDDFGTGYSSLSYLSQFPVDTLKIDKSFISLVSSDEGSNNIVKAIVALSKSLGLNIVAEGVETREQLAFLKGLGVDQMQGYFWARPMIVEELSSLESAAARLGSAAAIENNNAIPAE